MKLRVVYGETLSKDKSAKKMKLRVIMIAGFAVFLPFAVITYYLFSETNPVMLMSIGIMSALSCVPVVLFAYAKGYGLPLRDLWRDRPEELKALSLKIGFLYGFALYWMILGIVEFLFGYQSFRAALISFVASAAARDGFEIGYLRGREQNPDPMTIFPDDRPLTEIFTSSGSKVFLAMTFAILGSGITGFLLGPQLPNPLHQALAVGIVAGLTATLAYGRTLDIPATSRALFRYFLWPGFTMAITYFLILGYLLRIIFQIHLTPEIDFALLVAACTGWITLDSLFLSHLQTNKKADLVQRPEKEIKPVPT